MQPIALEHRKPDISIDSQNLDLKISVPGFGRLPAENRVTGSDLAVWPSWSVLMITNVLWVTYWGFWGILRLVTLFYNGGCCLKHPESVTRSGTSVHPKFVFSLNTANGDLFNDCRYHKQYHRYPHHRYLEWQTFCSKPISVSSCFARNFKKIAFPMLKK